MGCGENCACASGNDEILQAVDPSGKDVTEEVTGKKCGKENCQNGTCERCTEPVEAHGGCCKDEDVR